MTEILHDKIQLAVRQQKMRKHPMKTVNKTRAKEELSND